MKRLDKKVEIDEEDWILIRDHLIDMIVSGEADSYESKMSKCLEMTVQKYLYLLDDSISLTDIARRFDINYPSYLIQSWLRSRNTIGFLVEWERNNNPKFDESAFEKLIMDVCSPFYTLTPSKWIVTVNAIGLT